MGESTNKIWWGGGFAKRNECVCGKDFFQSVTPGDFNWNRPWFKGTRGVQHGVWTCLPIFMIIRESIDITML